jgi:hypothetical protein
MASEPERGRRRHGGALFALALVCALAWGQEKPARSSFSCIINGKKVVSDRLIPDCANSEQRELNADGSLKRIVRPVPTDDERAEIERRERDDKAKVVALNDAIRRDRNLMQRFPDEAAHKKAREKALDDVRLSAKSSATRIATLLDEKKKLDEEREFYENERVKKPLPTTLKQKIDANEASLEAQRSVSQNAQAELARINSNYDAELLRLKKLWSGTPAGSLGPLPDTRAPAAAPAASLGASKTPPSS